MIAMHFKQRFSILPYSSTQLNGASPLSFNQGNAASNHKKNFLPFLLLLFGLSLSFIGSAQDSTQKKQERILYGTASFYSNKFQGRKTANGEIFDQNKMTAACNVLPLGTWIRVTNLRNKKSVVVKVNDRLHTKMKRIVDLTRAAATTLGFTRAGLTRVKVEVLGKKKPAQ
jgi:rare lipoprotein A